MPPAPAQPTCPLCWTNRDGFRFGRLIGQSAHFYAFGYTADGSPDGEFMRASVNPKEHVADLSLMPMEAGPEVIVMFAMARFALGFDSEDGIVTASNLTGNIGSGADAADAGAIIAGHFHYQVHASEAGKPHSGMGHQLEQQMFDKWYLLLDSMVLDLAALRERGATAEEYAERVTFWEQQLAELRAEKERRDAYKRPALTTTA
jgi:hypothetical protein